MHDPRFESCVSATLRRPSVRLIIVIVPFFVLVTFAWFGASPKLIVILSGPTEELSRPFLIVDRSSSSCYQGCFQLSAVGPSTTGCPFSCVFDSALSKVIDNKRVAAADMVFDWISSSSKWRRPGQLLVGYEAESPENHRAVKDPAIMREYNYSFTYRASDTFPWDQKRFGAFWLAWSALRDKHLLPDPIPFEVKRKAASVSTVISGGTQANRRRKMIHILASSQFNISFAHYGTFLRSANAESANMAKWNQSVIASLPQIGGKYWTKIRAIAQHLFHFAAENSDCDWYHTEKVKHALIAGTVPIYLGSKTIEEYVPPGSIIQVRDFDSAKDLAKELSAISSSRERYEQYLSWRTKPLGEHIQLKMANAWGTESSVRLHCKFCEWAHRREPSVLKPFSDCHPPVKW